MNDRDHETPAGDFVAETTLDAGPVGQAPAKIGPYRLRQRLGEGGFGVVYVADQEAPIRRQVAVKVLKPGMGSAEVIARFEQERQALALMDHPHIATVLDAGTTADGRPYFVMELVRGEAITAYCDAGRLAIADRLHLFVQVCQAVQHAHHKGVIHRDIKPGNVLVCGGDEGPQVKVIDFGIAKAVAAKLSAETIFTHHHQIIGTPAYMSPEQAAGSLDVDTRTDVYSLGVLLYELPHRFHADSHRGAACCGVHRGGAPAARARAAAPEQPHQQLRRGARQDRLAPA